MMNVVVAGGLGGVGRAITEALLRSPKHQVSVLSRKAITNVVAFPVSVVDYSDVDHLAEVLQSNNTHTVISAIRVTDKDVGQAEINLVKAADMSKPTKRFISSDYGGMWPDPQYRAPFINARLATVDALRSTNLEFTTFHNGPMIDYFGLPGLKSYLNPITLWFDLANKRATIPGTGDDMAAFTYSLDVAKFVVAALDLPRWEDESLIYGDKLTFNDILKLYEARGEKWTVTYDSFEKLEKGEFTELPSHVPLYKSRPKQVLQAVLANYSILVIKGFCDISEDESLNKVFPDIKTTSVKDAIDAWFKHKQTEAEV